MTHWDHRFLELAKHIAQWSKDPSTKVGCVIVGPDREIRTTGFNGLPRGIRDDHRLHDRDLKYPIICHAEENAIMNAARIGVSLKRCILYSSLHPCRRCARGIIQAGIVSVITYEPTEERWGEECRLANAMFAEALMAVELVRV